MNIGTASFLSAWFLLIVSESSFAAGSGGCEGPTKPLSAGSYSLTVTGASADQVATFIDQTISFERQKNEALFEGVDINVVRKDNTSVVNKVYNNAGVSIFNFDDQSLSLVKGGRPTVFIPAYDSVKGNLSSAMPEISDEKDYYKYAAIHATRRILMNWSKENNEVYSTITIDHMKHDNENLIKSLKMHLD